MKATILSLLAGALLAAPALSQTQLAREVFATGVGKPLLVRAAPGDHERLFVLSQFGQIWIIKNGVRLSTPFLSLSGQTVGSGERGLLGMAFHPDFQNTGWVFVNFTDLSGNTQVRRYTVDPNNDDLLDPGSAQSIISVVQDFSNHNGGMIDFGPDGYLYIGMGDGGSAGDPFNRAQSGNQLLGKMLRLDVDNGLPYSIPPSNPFVGNAGVLDEIWALGLRNPWRFAFDSANGDLYIGDVGQNAWEEITWEAGGSAGGQNHGWKIMEGNNCYSPSSGCNQTGLTLPIYEYPHFGGGPFRCSVTGGEVYRGSQMARMHGRYFFADYCSGNLYSFRYDGQNLSDFVDHTSETGNMGSVVGFGVDNDGEVYVCNTSVVYKLVAKGFRMELPTLTGGQASTGVITGAAANTAVHIAMTRQGLGTTFIPPLGVTSDLNMPRRILSATTDSAGGVQITATAPVSLSGNTFWFQAAQAGLPGQAGQVSNVVTQEVQ